MIGHTTAAAHVCLHSDDCQCAICTEHRELTFVIAAADAAGWIVKASARQRLTELTQQITTSPAGGEA